MEFVVKLNDHNENLTAATYYTCKCNYSGGLKISLFNFFLINIAPCFIGEKINTLNTIKTKTEEWNKTFYLIKLTLLPPAFERNKGKKETLMMNN